MAAAEWLSSARARFSAYSACEYAVVGTTGIWDLLDGNRGYGAIVGELGLYSGTKAMTSLHRVLLLISAAAICSPIGRAQRTVTISEPRIFTLQALFDQADTVALVRIVSGDTENYGVPVYKASVIESVKGAAGETIYFGHYVGSRIGWEYVVFLQNTATPRSPKSDSSLSYGTIPYSVDFNEGYTTMETSYQCVFPGNDKVEQCDDAVRISTDYIRLPKSIAVSPPISEVKNFGFRWVRKNEYLALLRGLHGDAKR